MLSVLMDIIYVDIFTRKMLSSMHVANIVLIYKSVLFSSKREGDVAFSLKDHFIRVGENIMQYPINYISNSVLLIAL